MSVGSDKLRLLRQIPTVKFEEEMRGYSKSQVDRVLDTLAPLADEIETLEQQLNEANERADEASHRASAIAGQAMGANDAAHTQAPDGDFDQTLRNTLLLAQRTADQTIREAEKGAEELRGSSVAQADSIMAGARAEAKELKGEAHAQREQMLADAEAERAQLLADALEHAETRKAAIEEELLSEQGIRRNELLSEISLLERSRDDLSADVQRFEQFLEGRRENVRSALTELNAVLDDPELLAEAEIPEPAEIGLLDPEELTTLSIDSYSIGTLSTEVEAAQRQASDFAFTEPEFDPALEPELVGTVEDPQPLSEEFSAEESLFVEADGEGLTGEIQDAGPFSAISTPGEYADTSTSGEYADTSTSGEYAETSPAEDFAAATVSEESYADSAYEVETPFAAAGESGLALGSEDWEPFTSESARRLDPETGAGFGVADENPFATGGYAEPESGAAIAASVTPDSVFSSVPETADPSAYSDLPTAAEAPESDPDGLGIDVQSPFAEEPAAEDAQLGLGGLAEQARNRLASRVSRLRDTAVPESSREVDPEFAPTDQAPDSESASSFLEPPPPVQEPSLPTQSFDAPPAFPPAPTADAVATFVSESEPGFPPPPQVEELAVDSTPAFPSDTVGGSEWSVPDPDRPPHPDARLEDLPPDDPFLDELRQMTDGEQAGSDDETLNRFLSEEGEKESGGGWFGRRNK
jgi:cell division septum initiation protein DivIVA